MRLTGLMSVSQTTNLTTEAFEGLCYNNPIPRIHPTTSYTEVQNMKICTKGFPVHPEPKTGI